MRGSMCLKTLGISNFTVKCPLPLRNLKRQVFLKTNEGNMFAKQGQLESEGVEFLYR